MQTIRTFPHSSLSVYTAAQRFRQRLLRLDAMSRCSAIRRLLDQSALRIMLSIAEASVVSSPARRRRVLEAAVVACVKCAVLADGAADSGALTVEERMLVQEEAIGLVNGVNALLPPEEPGSTGDGPLPDRGRSRAGVAKRSPSGGARPLLEGPSSGPPDDQQSEGGCNPDSNAPWEESATAIP